MSRSDNSKLIFSGGRQTGSTKGDTYYRTLKPNHFLKYPELSIAVSVDVLDQLHALKVKWLEFKNAETQTRYRCTLDHFLECGVRFNRGYGNQVSLPLTGFIVTGKNLKAVYREDQNDKPAEDRKQLAFAGWL